VDPVLQPRAQPDQPCPVPQQRPQLTDRQRRDSRLRIRSARSNWVQVAAPALVVFSRAEAMALHRSGRTKVRLEAVVLEQVGQPALADAVSNATGVPDGRSPISRKIGAVPFTVFAFSCTLASSVTTAIWERLRCTSRPT
jgi:hypothetical protein